MDIPQDLSSLKRPALQSLAKNHGIKANGKSADIIKSLEELRDNFKLPSEDPVAPSQAMDSGPEPSIKVAANKRRTKRAAKKKRSKSNNGPVESSPPTTAPDSLSTDKATPTHIPSADQPFSPPANDGGFLSGSRKRKRNSTFTINVQTVETTIAHPPLGDSEPGGVAMETEPEVIPSPVEKRRLTFDIVPSPKKFKDSADSTDFMTELQNRLDSKVKEVQSAPDYKPVHTASNPAARSITMSQIKRKFDKAHSKQFHQMKSIADDRKRKAGTGALCPAKRPKLSEKRAPANKAHGLKTTVAKKPNNTKPAVFRPTVLSVKNVDLKFNSPKSVTKAAVSKLKTPKRGPISAAAIKKTPTTQTKRPGYSLEESLKKKPKYKPHTGPLPKFGYKYTK